MNKKLYQHWENWIVKDCFYTHVDTTLHQHQYLSSLKIWLRVIIFLFMSLMLDSMNVMINNQCGILTDKHVISSQYPTRSPNKAEKQQFKWNCQSQVNIVIHIHFYEKPRLLRMRQDYYHRLHIRSYWSISCSSFLSFLYVIFYPLKIKLFSIS